MTCGERKDLILWYAAGELDAAEAGELRAHLATGCPVCAGALAEAEATLAHLPLTVEPVAPPPGARARVLVAGAPGAPGVPGAGRGPKESKRVREEPRSEPTLFRRRLLVYAVYGQAAALILCCITVVQVVNERNRQTSQAQRLIAEMQSGIADLDRQVENIQTQLQTTEHALNMIATPGLKMVDLHASDAAPGAGGRVLCDPEHHAWLVMARGLAQLPHDKMYELWIIMPDQKKMPAGMFKADAQGKGMLTVNMPSDMGPIAMAAITDEPAAGSPQPTGQIRLLAKMD